MDIRITLKIRTSLVFFISNNIPIGKENSAAIILPIEIAPENSVLENPNSSDMGTINIDKFKLPDALETNCTNPTPTKTNHPKYRLDLSLIFFAKTSKIISKTLTY
tara:strand:+ start:4879 stop:5196 length:318 start_codon:yes stop_codon:yes gene_type:complete